MEFGNDKDSIQLLSQKKSGNCHDCFWASPFVKYVLPSFLVVVIILSFSYFGLINWLPLDDAKSQATCNLRTSYYVPCAPGISDIDKDECLELGCCWREDRNTCYHSYPSRYGYMVKEYEATTDGLEGNITASKKYSPTGKALREHLSFKLRQIDKDNFQISLITSPTSQSRRGQHDFAFLRQTIKKKKLADYGRLFDFLPSDDEASVKEFSWDNSSTKVLLHEPHFSLTLVDAEDKVMLSTARGPLIMTNNYWELTLYLADGVDLQGFDLLELNATTNWIYNNENRTIVPTILALRNNIVCQIVDYQAPLEIQVLNGSNLVILRGISIPENSLTINLYKSSNPLQTIQKLSDKQNYPELLSLSRLGLHICPDNHDSLTSALDSLEKWLNSTTEVNVAPWDSHCLSRRHFGSTLEHDVDLGLVDQALNILNGRKLVAHLTPMLFTKDKGLLLSSLKNKSCLLGNGNESYVGMYLDGGNASVVYPDWNEARTREIARDYLDEYTKRLKLSFVVLRDAWPRDDTTTPRRNTSDYDAFEYLPEGLNRLMSRGTIPYDLQNNHQYPPHFVVHNAYSSNFVDFVGSHAVELRGHECNSANIEVSWKHLRSIIEIGVVEAMMLRVPNTMYVCGADASTINDELCVRWYAVAVSWPRILSVPEKSPFRDTRLSVTSAMQVAKLLQLRATLTTYHRTTLASFAKEGKPIFADTGVYYPGEERGEKRSATQFLWGDSILVGLVLLPRHHQVAMWLPGEHSWKHLQGGSAIGPSKNNSKIPVTVAIGELALLIRPGRIIPFHQEFGNSTVTTALKDLNLVGNLICDTSNNCKAEGRVYFGDNEAKNGEFLLISYFNGALTLSKVLEAKKQACKASTPPTQTGIFSSFQVLGTASYALDLELCKLSGDVSFELQGRQTDLLA